MSARKKKARKTSAAKAAAAAATTTPAPKRQKLDSSSSSSSSSAAAAAAGAEAKSHKPKYSLMSAAAASGSASGATAGGPSVSDIFETLEYGPAPESASAFNAWLDDHGREFGHFIGNEWVKPAGRKFYSTHAPATGEFLANTVQGTAEDVDLAVQTAGRAQESWAALPAHVRARHMYAIARNVVKHARLIAVCEALDNGKTVRETRDSDVPLVARWLYHYAGWAQLKDTEMKQWDPVGVIGGIVPWNFPLMLLTWKVAPALAMGNTVVLKPATYTRLSALLFAEICAEAGLPPGVLNIITGSGRMGSSLAEHAGVDKVAFTGSTGVGQLLRRSTAGSGKKLSLELGGKSPVVVFDSADLDSVVEGVVDAIWFNQGQVCSAGSRLLVQEGVQQRLVHKIKERMMTLRLGQSLDKCTDMGPLVDQRQVDDVQSHIDTAREEGADVYQACMDGIPRRPDGTEGLWVPPTLITNVSSVSTIVQEEVFGPVLTVQSFRTAKEAIKLANNTRYGLGASVWTEEMALAMEVAISIKAGTVWVNGHNMFDAAAGFGGYRESGFGRDGGREGLYEYVRPSWETRPRPDIPKATPEAMAAFGGNVAPRPTLPAPAASASSAAGAAGPLEVMASPSRFHAPTSGGGFALPKIDRTLKVFYGGKQKRPDAKYARPVVSPSGQLVGQVAEGNRKDIRNAVEAAHKGAPGWGKRAAHNRAQIMYYIAENLELRFDEMKERIMAMTDRSEEDARAEVHASIRRLFHWAAYADKYGGSVQETTLYGATVKIHEPVGVVAIACPDQYPLLGFVSLFAPAVVRGNTIVIVPSESAPLSATDLYQIFETSDVPAGVVNIITGNRDHLTKYLVEHQDIDAMWYFGSAEGSQFVEYTSAGNIKRTWVNYGGERDWLDDEEGQGEEFLLQSTEVKNIWMPMGSIFAN